MKPEYDKDVQEDLIPVSEEVPVIVLSKAGSEVFANALLNPPEPNQAFKKASARYAEMVKIKDIETCLTLLKPK